jgi:hypothetical protein
MGIIAKLTLWCQETVLMKQYQQGRRDEILARPGKVSIIVPYRTRMIPIGTGKGKASGMGEKKRKDIATTT